MRIEIHDDETRNETNPLVLRIDVTLGLMSITILDFCRDGVR